MSKYTESARWQECQVRIAGICNHDNSTTVFAHINGAGMGMKHEDIFGAFSCSACHEWLDGGYIREGVSKDVRDLEHLRAMMNTQKIMIKQGALVL